MDDQLVRVLEARLGFSLLAGTERSDYAGGEGGSAGASGEAGEDGKLQRGAGRHVEWAI